MRVLVVSAACPGSLAAGSALRTNGWLRAAAGSASIGIVTLTRTAREQEQGVSELGAVCDFVRAVHAPRTGLRRGRDLMRTLVGGEPYAIAAAAERRLRREVEAAVATWRPDIVQADGIGAAPYLAIGRDAGIPTVYSAHNVESRIAAGAPGTAGAARRTAAARMRRAERRLASRATAVVAVSAVEAEWFRSVAGDVRCIPNAIDFDRYTFVPPSLRREGDLVFLGHLGYPPNVDAATRLVRRILPRIRRRRADVRCIVAGRAPVRAVRDLVGEGVQVLADVERASEIWRRAAILVCPLRWGGGSRLKLLEAAASGVPIAATPFAGEGLALQAGRDYLCGESDDELADAALSLLGDCVGADALADRGRATVAAEHDWRRWAGRIAELYEGLAGHHG